MTLSAAASRLLAQHPRQPDQRSCGPSVLVVERALRDDDYAAWLAGDADRFRDEVLGTHRRATGVISAAGRLQLPWPRALGTPPWGLAGELSASTGTRWTYRAALRREPAWDTVTRAVAEGHPSPVYVGSRWLPRHVVLALDGPVGGTAAGTAASVQCYEPDSGRVLTVSRDDFVTASFRLAGWTTPWFVVVPT